MANYSTQDIGIHFCHAQIVVQCTTKTAIAYRQRVTSTCLASQEYSHATRKTGACVQLYVGDKSRFLWTTCMWRFRCLRQRRRSSHCALSQSVHSGCFVAFCLTNYAQKQNIVAKTFWRLRTLNKKQRCTELRLLLFVHSLTLKATFSRIATFQLKKNDDNRIQRKTIRKLETTDNYVAFRLDDVEVNREKRQEAKLSLG